MSTELKTATKKDQLVEADSHLPRVIHYTVDGEPQETTEKTLTARRILSAAGVDTKTHYLVQVQGQQGQVSFKGRLSDEIAMEQQAKFLSVSTGPTTVS